MIAKSLMKHPVLMMGILLLSIFLFDLRDRNFFKQRVESLTPTSCKAVKVRLDRYLHKSWDITCNENNLVIEVPVDEKVISHKLADPTLLKQKMYKALANSYISISRYSPPDSLERTMMVSVRLIHPNMTINSVSEGRHVYNMKALKNLSNLAKHFSQTVQVQEVTK